MSVRDGVRGVQGRSPGDGAAEPCPICGRPSRPGLHPFCSVRCADVDLGQWLSGSYAIPVEPDEEDDLGPARPLAGQEPDR